MVQTEEEIKLSGLLYVGDQTAGIYRKGNPGDFHYEDKNGNLVTDEKQLERIKALVLPPAWTNVWIAKQKNAHCFLEES
jgi:DNA topoisomerase-1